MQIVLFFLFCGGSSLAGQGEFYTVYHDTQVLLKNSKKADALKKYYVKKETEDLLIFRNGIDRPIKLIGNIDFVADNIDFQLLGVKHSIPLDNVDSVYVGYIPKDLKSMIVDKYLNGTLLDKDNEFYMQLIVDGETQLYRRTKVKIRRANYNKALDIGNKEDTYNIKYEYFIYTESKGLLKVPKKNKSFLKLLRSYKGAASFFKKQDLDCKEEEDLELLITYINKK